MLVETKRRLVPKSVSVSGGPLPVEHSVVAQGCGLLTIRSHTSSVRPTVSTPCVRQLDGSSDVRRLNELKRNVVVITVLPLIMITDKIFMSLIPIVKILGDMIDVERIPRTIDQVAGGKLRDKNDEESWALLEDLALYDNESWNDPRDFAKPVKSISMPHDVPNAKTSRFEADFKQYQSEVTNKLDAFLKAFNDHMTGLLPSDTIKNSKLNTNLTSSARSHPAE
ncbi:hypothetical protein Tco_0612920 [Tanacetum coccineum]